MASSSDSTPSRGGLGGAGPLAVVWVVTLVVLFASVLWLEAAYDPPPQQVRMPGEPAAAETAGRSALSAPEQRTPAAEDASGAEADAAADDPAPAEAASPQPAAAPVDAEDAPGGQGPAPTAAAPGPSTGPLTLEPAPDPALVERVTDGFLPVTGPGGRQPWEVYARPFAAETGRPRIAIVLTGMGLNSAVTAEAVDRLPPEVTLAISPYAAQPQEWARRARNAGHETLVMVPMEPRDYPANDPGPHTLLTSLDEAKNRERLHYVMSRFTGYVGLVNHMGSRFTASAEHLGPILKELSQRGVLFLDARATGRTAAPRLARAASTPFAINSRYIDNEPAPAEIDRYLTELENIAERTGAAVGIGRPYPVTIERVARWAAALEADGFALAPITAVAAGGQGA